MQKQLGSSLSVSLSTSVSHENKGETAVAMQINQC